MTAITTLGSGEQKDRDLRCCAPWQASVFSYFETEEADFSLDTPTSKDLSLATSNNPTLTRNLKMYPTKNIKMRKISVILTIVNRLNSLIK